MTKTNGFFGTRFETKHDLAMGATGFKFNRKESLSLALPNRNA